MSVLRLSVQRYSGRVSVLILNIHQKRNVNQKANLFLVHNPFWISARYGRTSRSVHGDGLQRRSSILSRHTIIPPSSVFHLMTNPSATAHAITNSTRTSLELVNSSIGILSPDQLRRVRTQLQATLAIVNDRIKVKFSGAFSRNILRCLVTHFVSYSSSRNSSCSCYRLYLQQ